jgi:hypothetical protein
MNCYLSFAGELPPPPPPLLLELQWAGSQLLIENTRAAFVFIFTSNKGTTTLACVEGGGE